LQDYSSLQKPQARVQGRFANVFDTVILEVEVLDYLNEQYSLQELDSTYAAAEITVPLKTWEQPLGLFSSGKLSKQSPKTAKLSLNFSNQHHRFSSR